MHPVNAPRSRTGNQRKRSMANPPNTFNRAEPRLSCDDGGMFGTSNWLSGRSTEGDKSGSRPQISPFGSENMPRDRVRCERSLVTSTHMADMCAPCRSGKLRVMRVNVARWLRCDPTTSIAVMDSDPARQFACLLSPELLSLSGGDAYLCPESKDGECTPPLVCCLNS